jgi:hypothetical protein
MSSDIAERRMTTELAPAGGPLSRWPGPDPQRLPLIKSGPAGAIAVARSVARVRLKGSPSLHSNVIDSDSRSLISDK